MRVIKKLLSKAKLERKYAIIKGKTRSAMHTLAGPFTRYRQQMITKRRLGQRTAQAPPQNYQNHDPSPGIYTIPPSQIDLTPLPQFELDLEAGMGHVHVPSSHHHNESLEYASDHLVQTQFSPQPASPKSSAHDLEVISEAKPILPPRSMSIQRKAVPDNTVASTNLDDNNLANNITPLPERTPDPKLRPFLLDKVTVDTRSKRASLHELSPPEREEMNNNPMNKAMTATKRTDDPQIQQFEADLRALDADIEKMKMSGNYTREELAARQRKSIADSEKLRDMQESLDRVQELLLNPKRWPWEGEKMKDAEE